MSQRELWMQDKQWFWARRAPLRGSKEELIGEHLKEASFGPSPLSPAYSPLRTEAGITPGSPMVPCRIKQGSGSSVGKGSARAHLRPGS